MSHYFGMEERSARLRTGGQRSMSAAKTLVKAFHASKGPGHEARIIPPDESSGAVVKFSRCPDLGIEAFLDPMPGGPRFMALVDGSPVGDAKTVPEALRLVSRHCKRTR